ncbi:hypothetical protein EDC02_0121 [Micromonospora sp. Llam0]|nr:hypothetical protein EDC02_0121 [Micromonospora sp. Llam0]
MTTQNPPLGRNWHVLHGPVTPEELRAALGQIASVHGLLVTHPQPDTAVLLREDQSVNVAVRWRDHLPQAPDSQAHNLASCIHGVCDGCVRAVPGVRKAPS